MTDGSRLTATNGESPSTPLMEIARRRLENAGKGGGKLSRSETVTVRLDPKLRYLAELAARLHRRTLSSYIEWSIEASLGNNRLTTEPQGQSIKDEAEHLWDVDDADRFAKLALRYPHLLTHEEQVRWKLIRENGYLWSGCFDGPEHEWTWTVQESSLLFERLREHWTVFCEVAETRSGQDRLPTWTKYKPVSRPQQSLRPPPPSRPKPASAPKESTGGPFMPEAIF